MEDENEQMSIGAPAEETEEQVFSTWMQKVQSDPDMKALYDEAPEEITQVMREKARNRIQKRSLDKQFASGAQSSVPQNTADREARRQDALAKARAAQAEIDRDYRMSTMGNLREKENFGALAKGMISGLGGGGTSVFGESKGIAPGVAGLVSGAGNLLTGGGIEGAKQGYVQGRDATQEWIDSGKSSPEFDAGAGLGNAASILTPGGVATKLVSGGAKIAAGAGTGALFGALNQDTAKQGEIAPISQTAWDAGIGAAVGGGLAGAGVGAQKLSQKFESSRPAIAAALRKDHTIKGVFADMFDNAKKLSPDEALQKEISEQVAREVALKAAREKAGLLVPKTADGKAIKNLFKPEGASSTANVPKSTAPVSRTNFQDPDVLFPGQKPIEQGYELPNMSRSDDVIQTGMPVPPTGRSQNLGDFLSKPAPPEVPKGTYFANALPEEPFQTPAIKRSASPVVSPAGGFDDPSQFKFESQASKRMEAAEFKTLQQLREESLRASEALAPKQATFKQIDQIRRADAPKAGELAQPQKPMTFKELDSYEKALQRQKLAEIEAQSLAGAAPDQVFDDALAAKVAEESRVTADPNLMAKIEDMSAEVQARINAVRDLADKTQSGRRPPSIAEAALPQRGPDIAEAATVAAKRMDAPQAPMIPEPPVEFPKLAPNWKAINMEPRPTVTPRAMSRQPSPPIDVNSPQFEWAVKNDKVMQGMTGTEILSFLNAARSGNTPRAQEIYIQAMTRLGGGQ